MDYKEWDKLTKEEKREALLKFQAPSSIYRQVEPTKHLDLKGDKV